MHELSVTQEILQVILSHALQHSVKKILRIYIEVPSITDFEDIWLKRYFSQLSKNTIAEHADLSITRIPPSFSCTFCSKEFPVMLSELDSIQCPDCGSASCTLLSTGQYYIKNMEAE